MRERTTTRAGGQVGGREGTREEREENEERRGGPREIRSSLRSRGYLARRRLGCVFSSLRLFLLSLPLSLSRTPFRIRIVVNRSKESSANSIVKSRGLSSARKRATRQAAIISKVGREFVCRCRATFASCRTSLGNFCTLNVPVNYDLATH